MFCLAQDSRQEAEEEFDHSSFLGLNIGLFNLLQQSESAIDNPNIGGAFAVGLQGAWLPYRFAGLEGSVSFGSASPLDLNREEGRWIVPPSLGKFNRGMLQGGVLLSYPFDYFCLELSGGLGYSYLNGLNKRVFSLDGEPDYRYINYRSEGLNYYTNVQLRVDKQEGLNLILFVKYTGYEGRLSIRDTYSSGDIRWQSKQAFPTLDVGLSVIYSFAHKKKWIF